MIIRRHDVIQTDGNGFSILFAQSDLHGFRTQFVLGHPGVSTVLIGPRSIAELEQNLAAIEHPIPDALWTDLAAAGLLPIDTSRQQGPAEPSGVDAD